eukprot:m.102264 g.102264  ORF g.102264 m.102264 type:complete len:140 (+) comp13765_c0_seq5:744-1163(+)
MEILLMLQDVQPLSKSPHTIIMYPYVYYRYGSALKFIPKRYKNWNPKCIQVSSVTGKNMDRAWELMNKFQKTMIESGEFRAKRERQSTAWLWHHITDKIIENFKTHPQVAQNTAAVELQVRRGDITAAQGADMLLDAIK